MKKILLLIGLLGLCAVLSACASTCLPVCLGENLGAVDWNNEDLQSAVLIQSVARQSNLDQVDFSRADLTGMNLNRSSLNGTNLTGAQLIGADLRETLLSGALFINTNLSGAQFSKADLTGAALTTSDLSAANFSETRLVNSNLSRLNLSGAFMDEAQMAGINLERANLAGAQISRADLSSANLQETDLRGAWINLSRLISADLRFANLSGASLIGSDLTGARLNGAWLVGANLVGANFRGADLRGADLSQAILIATPALVAQEKMIDSQLRTMSEAQWKKLALGNTILDGARYNEQTRFPQGFTPPNSMIYLSASKETAVVPATPGDTRLLLRVAGSGNAALIFQPLADYFSSQNPRIVFSLTLSDSADGINRLGKGQAEIAISLRPPTAGELADIPDLRTFPIARDSLVVVVHWNNPITNLTTDQLRQIYSGEIQNWRELGGPDLKITPLRQENTLLDVFIQQVMSGRPFSEQVLPVPSNAAVRAEVATQTGAIGLLPGYLVDASVNPLKVNDVAYSSENVQSGQYPLIRPYYLLIRGASGADMLNFLKMLSEDEGKQIIRKEGLEP
jgi:uncharacterized protein YjbI with pentapeptide repeats/ABC-type phosphate transport system substrate-binding protein